MSKLTRWQRRQAAKAPNWIRHIAASKASTPREKPKADAADRWLAENKRRQKLRAS